MPGMLDFLRSIQSGAQDIGNTVSPASPFQPPLMPPQMSRAAPQGMPMPPVVVPLADVLRMLLGGGAQQPTGPSPALGDKWEQTRSSPAPRGGYFESVGPSAPQPTVGMIPRGGAQGQPQTGARMDAAQVQNVIDQGRGGQQSPVVGRAQQVLQQAAPAVGDFLSRLGPSYGLALSAGPMLGPLQPLRYLLNPTFRGQVNQGLGQMWQAASPALGGFANAAANYMFGPAPAGSAAGGPQAQAPSQGALPMVQQGTAQTITPAASQGGAVDLYTYSGKQLGERQTYRGRTYEWTGDTWRKVRG